MKTIRTSHGITAIRIAAAAPGCSALAAHLQEVSMMNPDKLLTRLRKEKKEWLRQLYGGTIEGGREMAKHVAYGIDLSIRITVDYEKELRLQKQK